MKIPVTYIPYLLLQLVNEVYETSTGLLFLWLGRLPVTFNSRDLAFNLWLLFEVSFYDTPVAFGSNIESIAVIKIGLLRLLSRQ